MGRAIAFIQYMPRKPIKHGIKVFAVCCSYTGVLLGFEVYCGSSAVEGTDNSAVAVVDRLLNKGQQPHQQLSWPHPLHRQLKAREDLDVPFLKLSNGAKDKVPRGWFREACINERLTLARSSTSNILLGKIVSKYASYIPLKLVRVVAILCNNLEGVSKAGVHLLHQTLRGTTQDTSMPLTVTGTTVTQRTTRPPFAQTA
eukprot:scaffold100628_cov85-Cyclotella_meneghiniana.AAC.4